MRELDYQGVCGLYCGLCPRFQSSAPSRCLGCQLGPQHDYCSAYRCSAKRGHQTCAACSEYCCERLSKVIGVGLEADSFVSHKPAVPNLERIREVGLELHLAEQQERRLLAEHLIHHYNEGRSMTLYCTACALMPPDLIRDAVSEIEALLAGGRLDPGDIKARAKAMKLSIRELAQQAGIDLKLRRAK
jgi:hypothetical protein